MHLEMSFTWPNGPIGYLIAVLVLIVIIVLIVWLVRTLLYFEMPLNSYFVLSHLQSYQSDPLIVS
jgi:uncharacterized membrane protein YqiK